MYVWLSKNVEKEGKWQRFYDEKYKINVQCLIFILQVRICDFSPYMWIPCTTFWVESISVKSVSNFLKKIFTQIIVWTFFPQYLAKSNISNHGFWWPCSLLKLEVYKKNLLFIGISVKRPWTRELKIYDSIYSVYTAILIIVSRESSNCNIVYCLSFLLIVFFFLYTLMLYLLCILNMELNDTDEQFYELIFFSLYANKILSKASSTLLKNLIYFDKLTFYQSWIFIQ